MTDPVQPAGPPSGRVLPPLTVMANVGRSIAQVASHPNVQECIDPAITQARRVQAEAKIEHDTSGQLNAKLTDQTDTERSDGMISLDELERIVNRSKRGLRTATLSDATDEGQADWDPCKVGSDRALVLQQPVSGASLAARSLRPAACNLRGPQ